MWFGTSRGGRWIPRAWARSTAGRRPRASRMRVDRTVVDDVVAVVPIGEGRWARARSRRRRAARGGRAATEPVQVADPVAVRRRGTSGDRPVEHRRPPPGRSRAAILPLCEAHLRHSGECGPSGRFGNVVREARRGSGARAPRRAPRRSDSQTAPSIPVTRSVQAEGVLGRRDDDERPLLGGEPLLTVVERGDRGAVEERDAGEVEHDPLGRRRVDRVADEVGVREIDVALQPG